MLGGTGKGTGGTGMSSKACWGVLGDTRKGLDTERSPNLDFREDWRALGCAGRVLGTLG